jgi:hypothetical protein
LLHPARVTAIVAVSSRLNSFFLIIDIPFKNVNGMPKPPQIFHALRLSIIIYHNSLENKRKFTFFSETSKNSVVSRLKYFYLLYIMLPSSERK